MVMREGACSSGRASGAVTFKLRPGGKGASPGVEAEVGEGQGPPLWEERSQAG